MFIMGFFWKRTTSNAALFATIGGFAFSCVLEFLPRWLDESPLASIGFAKQNFAGVYEIPFLDRMEIVFGFCVIGMVIVSLLGTPPAAPVAESLGRFVRCGSLSVFRVARLLGRRDGGRRRARRALLGVLVIAATPRVPFRRLRLGGAIWRCGPCVSPLAVFLGACRPTTDRKVLAFDLCASTIVVMKHNTFSKMPRRIKAFDIRQECLQSIECSWDVGEHRDLEIKIETFRKMLGKSEWIALNMRTNGFGTVLSIRPSRDIGVFDRLEIHLSSLAEVSASNVPPSTIPCCF